jgi:hypothetical protein
MPDAFTYRCKLCNNHHVPGVDCGLIKSSQTVELEERAEERFKEVKDLRKENTALKEQLLICKLALKSIQDFPGRDADIIAAKALEIAAKVYESRGI